HGIIAFIRRVYVCRLFVACVSRVQSIEQFLRLVERLLVRVERDAGRVLVVEPHVEPLDAIDRHASDGDEHYLAHLAAGARPLRLVRVDDLAWPLSGYRLERQTAGSHTG